jgi:hypothetical protein
MANVPPVDVTKDILSSKSPVGLGDCRISLPEVNTSIKSSMSNSKDVSFLKLLHPYNELSEVIEILYSPGLLWKIK